MDVQLATILNSIEGAILSIDDSSHVVFLNEAAGKLLGCAPEEVIGQPASHVARIAELVEQLEIDFSSHSSQPARAVRRLQCPRVGGGETIPMEAVVSHVWLDGRRLFTAALRDLTFQQQMERAVYEARKTQALGALASGIAHDFNNVLAAVISQIDLALYSPGFPPHLREHLIHAQTSARRGAELVGKLQAFSRQGKLDLAPTNLAEVVDQVVFLLRRSVDPKVVIQAPKPVEKLWEATADASQLMQALLNLGVNARDAMPRGGTLTVSMANVQLSPEECLPPRKPGEFVRLSVSDTGTGMPPDIASRVFEPYFTTKDLSRGPGLGLSITAAVVAEHSGWMEVESAVGRGSTFSMFLPRSRALASAPRPVRVAEATAAEGKERILVVDDEELVRMVTKAVLAYRGYHITEACDGQEAVEKYAANPGAFDLVMLDLHMPRLNGHEALLRIREINPRAKVVMLSGGLQEIAEGNDELARVAFLQKPFENQELLRLIRQLLDSM
jgi:PAS domain S-box-containing protein